MARGGVADVADGRARAVPRASSPLREVQSGKERIRRAALYQGSAQAVERARTTARRARIRGGRLFNCRYSYLALDFEIRVANPFDDYPNVKRWYVAIAARPAVQRAWHVPPRNRGIPMP